MTSFIQQELSRALTHCVSEPMHQIGKTQPHGAMVVTDSGPDLRIFQVSTDLASFLGLEKQETVGKPWQMPMPRCCARHRHPA
ncbi:MAG: hypothetical protein K9K38_06590 [Rhodoferax sp.]|nr:hypothetical protein [Rhodoferax sp.]